MKKERHVLTVSFYAYGTPEECIKEGGEICKRLRDEKDNHAEVEKLHRLPFGSIEPVELDCSTFKPKK